MQILDPSHHLLENFTILCTMLFIIIEQIKFLPKSFKYIIVLNYIHITLLGIFYLYGYLMDLSKLLSRNRFPW